MEYCLFRLYAPLVSWGETAIGFERRSSTHPSKSAITGLIGAALGITRNDSENQRKLTNFLGVSVKVLSCGGILKDFHTISDVQPDKKIKYNTRKEELSAPSNKQSTVLSSRTYRTDSLYIVSVWGNNSDFSLKEIKEALLKPVFHLYLGRKSCPLALPLQPKVVESETLKESYDKVKFNMIPLVFDLENENTEKYFKHIENKIFYNEKIFYYWDTNTNHGFGNSLIQKNNREDLPISRERWQFSSRDEFMTIIDNQEVKNVYQ